MKPIKIVGGGLAGTEASYQLLKRGFAVTLYEMRPEKMTECHRTADLAELVCSNSLKSKEEGTASGLLKRELEAMDSLLLRAANAASVPGGSALTVDRRQFSAEVYKVLSGFENFTLIREEYTHIDDTDAPLILASGPMTSETLAKEIMRLTGAEYLNFFDAVAPIVDASTIDYEKAFFASRYQKGDAGDYLNCAMDREQYTAFHQALASAERVILKEFEKRELFEGCMPVEVLAKRGVDTLRFGAMKPVGIRKEGEEKRPYAVVQLRRENTAGTMYNLVGFQTNLTFPEQRRVFRMIPGLEQAEFLRYGVMHKNIFLDSPAILNADFSMKKHPHLFFAGQITGVEGYVESIMSGLLAGRALAEKCRGKEAAIPPETTISGALSRYISQPGADFQPMNANFGILPPMEGIRDKKLKKISIYMRGVDAIMNFING